MALTREIAAAIGPILSDKREPVEPQRATTAVFYSITNCQRGLAGVSFGHFLIKQVVEEVSREVPRVGTFVTLSPAPNFADWLKRERSNAGSAALDDDDREALAALDDRELVACARARRTRCASRCCAPPPGITCAPATAAACRSTRWRASISATARGWSGSTFSPTPRSARSSSPTA